jgi:hypothetical protein
MLKGFLSRVEEIIRQGQEHGEIRQDLDPRALAVIFWGMMPPSVILWHVSDGRFDVTRHAERAWKMFSEAIRASGETAPRPITVSGETKEDE